MTAKKYKNGFTDLIWLEKKINPNLQAPTTFNSHVTFSLSSHPSAQPALHHLAFSPLTPLWLV